MNLYTFTMVADATRRHVLSARPDAPTELDPPPEPRTVLEPTRRTVARTLRQLADRLEPCPRPVRTR